MNPIQKTEEFAAAIRNLSAADLVRTAAELNQQSLLLITHLMMIADEIARRDSESATSPGNC
jgi:hypothetical protein